MAKLEIIIKLEPNEIQNLRFLIENTKTLISHINSPFLTENGIYSWADSQKLNLSNLQELINQLELIHAV